METKQKPSLGPWAIVIILIGVVLVVLFTIRSFQQSRLAVIKQDWSVQQADSLAASVGVFRVLSGHQPLSMVDRLPSGKGFFTLLPGERCFTNTFTGLRTEPRFFDRIYEEASPGTLALVWEGRRFYLVVYGKDQRVYRKTRL